MNRHFNRIASSVWEYLHSKSFMSKLADSDMTYNCLSKHPRTFEGYSKDCKSYHPLYYIKTMDQFALRPTEFPIHEMRLISEIFKYYSWPIVSLERFIRYNLDLSKLPDLLSTLTDREATVIRHIFAVDGINTIHGLSETARCIEALGFNRVERMGIAYIRDKSLRKMRHISRIDIIKVDRGRPLTEASLLRDTRGMINRSINALRRSNINTVAELITTPMNKLFSITHLGIKSINNIIVTMRDEGFPTWADLVESDIINCKYPSVMMHEYKKKYLSN